MSQAASLELLSINLNSNLSSISFLRVSLCASVCASVCLSLSSQQQPFSLSLSWQAPFAQASKVSVGMSKSTCSRTASNNEGLPALLCCCLSPQLVHCVAATPISCCSEEGESETGTGREVEMRKKLQTEHSNAVRLHSFVLFLIEYTALMLHPLQYYKRTYGATR